MHELGLVFHIAKSVEAIAKENHADHIRSVVLEVGEVSAVIPSYLQDCWKWNAKKSELLADCSLEVEILPAVTLCEDCGAEYETVKHGKICPKCGSEHTYLLTGNEVNIKEITVSDPEGLEAKEEAAEP